MIRALFFLLLFPIVNCTRVSCQDYIIKINQGIETIQVNDLSINDDFVSYHESSSVYESSLHLDDVISINFNSDKPDELNIFSFNFDTIQCTIDSISANTVFYRNKNNQLQNINKDKILSLHFNELSANPEMDNYKNLFIQLQKSANIQKTILVKKEGINQTIVKLLSLNKGQLEIITLFNGVEVKTKTDKTKIKSIIIREPIEGKSFYSKDAYLLTHQGNYNKIFVNNIKTDEIGFDIIINKKRINTYQNKNSVDALFFYDFRETETTLKHVQLTAKSKNTNKTQVQLNVNAGLGYLIASAPADATAQQKDYINELRSGFTLDANFDVFFTNNIGVGIKYNQFNTKNSINNIKDDIKVSFIGLSLLSKVPIKNNKGFYYTSLSLGYASEVNNGEFNGIDLKVKGSAFGAYLAFGLDFYLTPNVAINLQSGVLLGKINDYDINGQNYKLDEPENLARLDGLVGLKFFF